MPPLISPHLPSSLETECSYPINRQRAATLKIDMAHLEYYAPACRPKYHLCQCAPKAQPRPCALPAQQLSRRQPTTNGQLTVSGPLILVARPGSTWSATEARERAAASSGWHLGDGVGEAVTMCEGRLRKKRVASRSKKGPFLLLRAGNAGIPYFHSHFSMLATWACPWDAVPRSARAAAAANGSGRCGFQRLHPSRRRPATNTSAMRLTNAIIATLGIWHTARTAHPVVVAAKRQSIEIVAAYHLAGAFAICVCHTRMHVSVEALHPCSAPASHARANATCLRAHRMPYVVCTQFMRVEWCATRTAIDKDLRALVVVDGRVNVPIAHRPSAAYVDMWVTCARPRPCPCPQAPCQQPCTEVERYHAALPLLV